MGYFPHGSREGIRDSVRSLKTMGSLSRTRLMYLAHAVEGVVQEKPYRGNHISGSRDWASQTRFSGSPGFESSVTGHTCNIDWVMGRGAKDEPDKGGTGTASKTEKQPDQRQGGHRERGIHHPSSQEIADHKHKGLCFRCGGNYHPRHQCPDHQLRIMVTEEDEDEEGEVNEMVVGTESDEEEGALSVMSLSGLVMAKNLKLRTMKLKERFKGYPF